MERRAGRPHLARQHRRAGGADRARHVPGVRAHPGRDDERAPTPTARSYNDPGIRWISYFNGGDACTPSTARRSARRRASAASSSRWPRPRRCGRTRRSARWSRSRTEALVGRGVWWPGFGSPATEPVTVASPARARVSHPAAALTHSTWGRNIRGGLARGVWSRKCSLRAVPRQTPPPGGSPGRGVWREIVRHGGFARLRSIPSARSGSSAAARAAFRQAPAFGAAGRGRRAVEHVPAGRALEQLVERLAFGVVEAAEDVVLGGGQAGLGRGQAARARGRSARRCGGGGPRSSGGARSARRSRAR